MTCCGSRRVTWRASLVRSGSNNAFSTGRSLRWDVTKERFYFLFEISVSDSRPIFPISCQWIRLAENRREQACEKSPDFLDGLPFPALATGPEARPRHPPDRGAVADHGCYFVAVSCRINGSRRRDFSGILTQRIRIDHDQPSLRREHVVAVPHIPPSRALAPQGYNDFQEQVVRHPEEFIDAKSGFDFVLEHIALDPLLDEIMAFGTGGIPEDVRRMHLLNVIVRQTGQKVPQVPVEFHHLGCHRGAIVFRIEDFENFQSEIRSVFGVPVAQPGSKADHRLRVAAGRVSRAPTNRTLRSPQRQNANRDAFHNGLLFPAHFRLLHLAPLIPVVWLPINHGIVRW
jgi:hypothetical protein